MQEFRTSATVQEKLRSFGVDEIKRLLVVASKCPVHKLIAGETDVTIADKIETL